MAISVGSENAAEAAPDLGGAPGGVPGGVIGGVLGGVLGGTGTAVPTTPESGRCTRSCGLVRISKRHARDIP